jgi:hypothetical protein
LGNIAKLYLLGEEAVDERARHKGILEEEADRNVCRRKKGRQVGGPGGSPDIAKI